MGAVDSPNLYAYVGLRPYSANDPLGLARLTASGGVNVLGDILNETDLDDETPWWQQAGIMTADVVGNTVSDLLMLDTIAEKSAVVGDVSRSTGERVKSGAVGVGVAVLDVAGGEIMGTAGRVLTRIPGVKNVVARVGESAIGRFLSQDAGQLFRKGAGKTISVAPRRGGALTGPFKGPYTEGIPAGTLDDVSVRKWYHQQLDAIPGKIDRTQPLRNQARQAFELRNQARVDARALMADRAKALGYDVTDPIRTLQEQIRYAVEVRGKQGSEIWEYILESSTRSRPSVDAAAGLAR